MDNRYTILEKRCSICGGKERRVVLKGDNPTMGFAEAEDGTIICQNCENKYHLLKNFNYRGYGYKYSTDPRFTAMDKASTLTFGIEIEVAGSIKNINEIQKIIDKTYECSIGYDTSVEGAQFELSYAPGTYYWYLYESNLKKICKLLEQDKWTKKSETIGMHIHVGNCRNKGDLIRLAVSKDDMFWKILMVAGERKYNNYCFPLFTNEHHNAIATRTRWGTIEFRIFSGTYNFEKILKRIRFIRQFFANLTETGVKWNKFDKQTKEWYFELLNSEQTKKLLTEEDIEKIRKIFNGEIEPSHTDISADEITQYWLDWYDENYNDDDDYEREEDEEYTEW